MELEEFENKFIDAEKLINIEISKSEIKKLYNYMNLLLEWNENINLTAITDKEEIIKKHFIDSLTISNLINDNCKVIDVGTGAGFPGIPLAITRNIDVTLLDSLNKRVNFLNEVKDKIELENINTIHSRAEELSRNKEHREKYDVATSRAVAPMNVLLEYLLPFVKVGGICICMKGPNINEEMADIDNIAKILGGKYVKTINLKIEEIERNIVIIEKIKPTNTKYPRKAGIPAKQPLGGSNIKHN